MRDESIIAREESRLFSAGALTRLRGAVSAGAAVAVLAGLVIWGYRLSARDPLEVPVIRAMEGPARTAPEEAEGARFAYQERDVYAAVTDQDEVDAPALAPPPPRLSAEDVPPASLAAQAEAEAAGQRAREAAAQARAALETGARAGVAPIAPPAAATPPAEATAEVDALVQAALASPSDPDPVPAPASAGGAMQVQLGAYLTEADAWANWRHLQRKFPRLADHDAAVSPITAQGRELQALRVNSLPGATEARALCDGLKADGADCFLVGGG